VYSGVERDLGAHRQHVLDNMEDRETRVTSLLQDILREHGAPRHIDYFSLDIEGGEYSVLSTFPFDLYSFGAITVEHNFEEPKRTLVRELLQRNGYRLERDVEWDAWFVRERPVVFSSTGVRAAAGWS
jgi:hypothetical protein